MCAQFRDEFASRYPDSQVLYASKAYINPSLARIFSEEGLGLDVVSGGELAVAQAADFNAELVYFHGNNKGPEELEAALDWGIGRVVVDNPREMDLLNEMAGARGKVQDILIRISRASILHTHSHTTTGILDSKFGIPIETGLAEQAVQQAMSAPNLRLIGLHFHLGSPIYEIRALPAAIDVTMSFAAEMQDRHGLELKEFSPGGGFAIQYTADEPPPEVSEYASAITSAILERTQTPPRLLIEPDGRLRVGGGWPCTASEPPRDVPASASTCPWTAEWGDNIRPAIYGSRYEAVVANRASAPPEETVTIAGKFCESGHLS